MKVESGRTDMFGIACDLRNAGQLKPAGRLMAAAILGAACATVPRAAPPCPPMHDSEYPYPWPDPHPGRIVHVPTGQMVTVDQMMDMMAGSRVVFFGETHDNVHSHEAELTLLRGLDRRRGGAVALAMEMFRSPHQDVLDRWTTGGLSEAEFLKESDWFHGWGADWHYYRDLLLYAREHRLDVLALNPPEELQRAVGKTPFEALPPELKARLPNIGEPDPYETEYLRAMSAGHKAVPGMFEAFDRVQRLWEESMAERTVAYLGSARGQGKTVLVLAGGAHVRYGFGVPKKLVRRMAVPYSIVVSEEVEVPPEMRRAKGMEVSLPRVPLLPADFAWLMAYEDLDGKRVRLGVRFEPKDGAVGVAEVLPDSPAAAAGIKAGDVIAAVDGQKVADGGDLLVLLTPKKPGDSAELTVRRDGAERQVTVTFPAGQGK